MTIPNEGFMKKCGDCKIEKPLTEFYIRNNGYPHSRCKVCYRKHVSDYRKANKEMVTANHRLSCSKKRARVKEAVFAAYGGYVCACCGETEKKFLSLDHINNDGAEMRRRIGKRRTFAGVHTYLWLARNGFPAGYQILCMNCNHGKRMNNGVCPHKATCNDHPLVGVGPSGPKRLAPVLKVVG